MRTRFRWPLSIAVLLVMLVAWPEPAASQGGGGAGPPTGPIPRTPDGKPDLRGQFNGRGRGLTHTVILEEHGGGFGIQAGHSLIIDPPDGVIPYRPWALAERNRRREDANGYEDPVGHCEFFDIGRLQQFAYEFIYGEDQIVIASVQNIMRVVDMTRREHLPEGIRLWLGDPIGWWEGDTLVVESTNFSGKTWMAIGGDFYSADAVVVERFTMVDSNTINWTMTITDPDVFTRPWTMTSAVPMTRGVQGQAGTVMELFDSDSENTCHEGNVHLRHLKNVYDQARTRASEP